MNKSDLIRHIHQHKYKLEKQHNISSSDYKFFCEMLKYLRNPQIVGVNEKCSWCGEPSNKKKGKLQNIVLHQKCYDAIQAGDAILL